MLYFFYKKNLCFFHAIKLGNVLNFGNKGKKKVIHNFVKSLTMKGCAHFINTKRCAPTKYCIFFFFTIMSYSFIYSKVNLFGFFCCPFSSVSLSLLSLFALSLSLSFSPLGLFSGIDSAQRYPNSGHQTHCQIGR